MKLITGLTLTFQTDHEMYQDRNGEQVYVLRQLDPWEPVTPEAVYRVRFADGVVIDAKRDELHDDFGPADE